MKKINNKGFAISTIIYSILIIAILIMGMLYSTIAFRKKTSSDFTHKVEEELNNLEIKSYTICKKSTALHYSFGKLYSGDTLEVGDAFDCDVNGDGAFDTENERFYYLAPENGDTNSNNIVFIYFSNAETINENGVTYPVAQKSSSVAYDSSASGGVVTYQTKPSTAFSSLPSTASWKNTSLILPGDSENHKVNILDESGAKKVANFEYKDRSARFPRLSELKSALGITTIYNDTTHTNSVNSTTYNFLFERTDDFCSISNLSNCTYGYWIEEVSSSVKHNAWVFDAKNKKITTAAGNNKDDYGIRPVIVVDRKNVYYK